MPNARRLALVAIALFLAGGCGPRGGDWCFGLLDPCDPPNVRQNAFFYITGIPIDHVDLSTTLPSGGYRATLHVADTVVLHLLEHIGRDTVSNYDWPLTDATWSVSDSSVARIVNRPADGSVLLTLLAPGELLPIRAGPGDYQPDTHWYNTVWACVNEEMYGCVLITDVVIVQ